MIKQVRCRCDAMVDVETPDSIDLDVGEGALARLADGESPQATCPRCGVAVRAELPLRVAMKSAGLDAVVLPESERLAAYRGKANAPAGVEVLLGYQELFERARCLRDGLTPLALEALKHAIEAKADESGPAEGDVVVLYNGLEGGSLAFHVLGLKPGEAGVIRVPRSAYDSIAEAAARQAGKEPYKTLGAGHYHGARKLELLESE